MKDKLFNFFYFITKVLIIFLSNRHWQYFHSKFILYLGKKMNIIVLFPKSSERRLVMFTKPVLKKISGNVLSPCSCGLLIGNGS